MKTLRPFQSALKAEAYAQWQGGAKNVLAVLPTGGGKTVFASSIVSEHSGACAFIAHRGELVGQISLALAGEGIMHRIIGPDSLRKTCVALHLRELKRSFHDAGSRVAACGVDTLVLKETSNDSWFRNVSLWVQDEAHHVQKANKWGRAADMFPNARGLGLTATPGRADGHGLGRDSDGLFDALVEGPAARQLIDEGYLTDYRIFAPPSDVDYSEVTVTGSGDYSPAKLRAAVHASDKIVGDVVKQYLRIAPGKLGITFAVDIESAQEISRAFRAAGVPSEVVCGTTPELLRVEIMGRFRRREILQLVNVDLFGEGFDLPALEVVSMVRKTESFALFAQQFGRALRLMIEEALMKQWPSLTPDQRKAHIAASAKPKAIIIDHVGNVIRHGLPDAVRVHSLAARAKRSTGPSDAIPLRTCANVNMDGRGVPCAGVYERYHKNCPYCGFYPEPISRSSPDMVDGDLFELDPAALQALRGEVSRIDGAARIPGHLNAMAARGAQNQHFARQQAQGHLRNTIAVWAGWKRTQGRNDSESYRMFYHRYGVDVMSAMALGATPALELQSLIQKELDESNVVLDSSVNF